MATVLNRLRQKQIDNAPVGWHADGGGLYLLVGPSGSKSWVYRYKVAGKVTNMGLGSLDAIGLAAARVRASECREAKARGSDPLADRRAVDREAKREAAKSKTFKECALAYIEAHETTWRNPKHRQQWRNTLDTYVYPSIGSKLVADVETADVLAILQPIWQVKPETAGRVRGRIEQVLDYAAALDLRPDENPARWQGKLKKLLPSRTKVRAVEHHAALPYADLPGFMGRLREDGSKSSLALQLTILTACRSGEVLNAVWSEFDLDEKLWIIPAERMKAGKEHRIPLSDAAAVLLKQAAEFKREGEDWVFPGERDERPLSNMAMTMMLRRLKANVTAHGFRSTFRDWAAETTAYPSDVVEMALAHAVGNKVEAAYRRGDLFDKRRLLMTDWAGYCAKS